jgi:hypothetical protein
LFADSALNRSIVAAQGPAALVFVCLLVLASPHPPLFAAETDALDQAIADLVVRLDSPVFAEREEAARLLREFGFFTIAPLTQAAQTGSLEVAVRAVEILEAIYQTAGTWVDDSGKPTEPPDAPAQVDTAHMPFAEQLRKFGSEPRPAVETADAAEAALEQLKLSTNRSVAGRAATALDRNYAVRERLALAAIRRLGGGIDHRANAAQNVVRIGPNIEDVAENYFIRLDDQWTGGDEGLQQIKRLNRLHTLYIIDGTNVSAEAIKDLQAALPNLNVQFRGEAFLGISGTPNQFGGLGCLVESVQPGGAAERAGIRRGDMIVHFGGKPVTDFAALIDLIGG